MNEPRNTQCESDTASVRLELDGNRLGRNASCHRRFIMDGADP